MSSGSQQPVTQQTTQTKDPWSAAQPFLQNAMSSAGALYNSNIGYTPYSGPTQAPLDPWLQAGLTTESGQAWNDAYAGGPQNVKAAQGLAQNMITNQGLSPQLQSLYQQAQGDQNPYLQGVINQQMDKVNSAMSGSGRYGSGSHDAAIAQAISPTLAQDYARRQQQQQDILTGGLQRAGQWSQLAPSLYEAQYAPMQRLQTIGQYQQDRSQAALNDQIKMYNASQAYPWEQLARFNAIVGGAGGLGGTSVTSSPVTQPSTLQRLLGGGLAGAGLGGSIFGAPGAAAGGIGGGLLGLLG